MGVDDRVATLCACGDHAATTYCEDCALALCAECSNVRHGDSSSANVHHRCMPIDSLNMEELVDTHRTSFDHVDKLLHDDSGEDKKAYSIRGVQTALSHHQSSAFFTGLDREDPDQELSPTPPTKTPTTNSSDPSSYDMWGSWSVRAFRHRSGSENVTASTSSSLNGIDEWQGFRSMSSDDSADTSTTLSLSADETLPLGSITRSLRSLSFASNPDELDQPRATTAPPTHKRSLRPRSFSDYTTLGSGKLHDVWHDRVPEFQSLAAAPLQQQTSLVTTTGLEMYRAMTTAVASRHVIIKSTTMESLDASCMQSVRAALNSFGAVASMRDEFVNDGVLFCTFYELKAAIGAVKMWSSTMPSRIASVETSAHFSIPYEPLDEINCATVLVHIHGPYLPSSASDIRKLCSRFGEVASVLEKEGHDGSSSQYIVEFNDVRDVVSVMSQLTGSVLPSGHILSMTRSHPPTLDLMKIQVFQECAGKISASRTTEKTPRFGNRPKSYSECTTVLTSPTSLSSSMSFLDGGVSRSAPRNEMDEYSLRADDASPPDSGPSSPFSQRLQPSGDVWRTRESARPRSSSAYATLTGGTSSSLLADAFQSSASHAARSSAYIPSYRSATQSPPLHSQQAFGSVASRLGPIRTGSDPGFRHSYASSNASTTGSVGRNDQGTGEFSLSIDKVMSGEDTRTTLMVRNIPNKYTQQMLLSEINCNHHGKYDFFYLPIDFKNKCNMGYAFINFIDAASIVPFYQEFDAQKWTNFNSEKVCAISYARLQGKQAMITRFQNSSLLDKHESYRPLVFHSSGPNRGQPETFPAPKPSTSHQHLNPHHFLSKPKMHQHHQSHSHLLMSASDEYLLAGRLYAQQQHHALLANAHAAAAAMLHNMPALGLPPNALASQYAQQRSFQYRGAYPAAQGFDRRQGHPYPSTLNPAHVPGSNVYSGAGFSSSSA